MRFATAGEDRNIPADRDRSEFADESALADARRSHHVHHGSRPADGLVEYCGEEGEFTGAPHQRGLASVTDPVSLDGQQAPRDDRGIRVLHGEDHGRGECHRVLRQPRGRFAEQHAARGRDRFQSLGYPDLLTDRGVAAGLGPDLTGDDSTGVQPDAQLQSDPVVSLDLSRQNLRFLLNGRCGQTCPERVVLESQWRPEHRHDSVAGELVDRAAVAAHHRGRAREQLRHDLPQPFRSDRGGDGHGPDHIGEQHGHPLVLGMGVRVREF